MPDKRVVYLIDASVFIFRAWFSIPDRMTNPAGEPVNAVYGFAGFLADLRQQAGVAPVAAAFDESLTTSFRNEIYPDYKANRPPAPDAFKRQFAWCQQLCSALGLPWAAHPRWEADDIIGTWAAQARAGGHAVAIVSRDKDLTQLLEDDDHFWDYAGGRRLAAAQVREQFGVMPTQIADFLALAGDAVDNIPGIRGIGPKAAAALLAEFGDLDTIYARIDEVPGLPIRGAKSLAAKLADGEPDARLSRQLTGIVTDAAIDPLALEPGEVNADALERLCDELGFGRGLRTRLTGPDVA